MLPEKHQEEVDGIHGLVSIQSTKVQRGNTWETERVKQLVHQCDAVRKILNRADLTNSKKGMVGGGGIGPGWWWKREKQPLHCGLWKLLFHHRTRAGEVGLGEGLGVLEEFGHLEILRANGEEKRRRVKKEKKNSNGFFPFPFPFDHANNKEDLKRC